MAGFYLIELLIVVVIIGVLAAIAIPAYTQYTVRAARKQAEATMLNLSQMEERYFTNNYAYYAVTAAPATDLNGWSNFSGSSMDKRKYDIKVTVGLVPPSFLIEATPSNTFVDAQCGILKLDNMGVKSSTGSSSSCW